MLKERLHRNHLSENKQQQKVQKFASFDPISTMDNIIKNFMKNGSSENNLVNIVLIVYLNLS